MKVVTTPRMTKVKVKTNTDTDTKTNTEEDEDMDSEEDSEEESGRNTMDEFEDDFPNEKDMVRSMRLIQNTRKSMCDRVYVLR